MGRWPVTAGLGCELAANRQTWAAAGLGAPRARMMSGWWACSLFACCRRTTRVQVRALACGWLLPRSSSSASCCSSIACCTTIDQLPTRRSVQVLAQIGGAAGFTSDNVCRILLQASRLMMRTRTASGAWGCVIAGAAYRRLYRGLQQSCAAQRLPSMIPPCPAASYCPCCKCTRAFLQGFIPGWLVQALDA